MNSIEKQAFKGNYYNSGKNSPYYKTNSGLKVGGVLAGISAVSLGQSLYKKNYANAAGNLGAIAAHIACGIIYDNIRNKKAQNSANEIRDLGVQNTISKTENLKISQHGNTYYNSNIGKKYGAISGAGFGLAFGLISALNKGEWNKITKEFVKDGFKVNKPTWVAGSIAILATLGMLVGKIADYFSNKDAYTNS